MAASRFATFLESFDRDPKTRGTQWEHVCKWFLETDPVYRTQLKKVWLWDLHGALWEEGFAQLLTYVEAEGHTRVPRSHRTADGYRLGLWVNNQRGTKDKLSADRRQRLEGVAGWVWVIRARPSKHGRKKP